MTKRVDLTERDRQVIGGMCGVGLDLKAVAAIWGWHDRTLRRLRRRDPRLEDAVSRGRAEAEKTVAESLYRFACAGSIPHIIYFERTRCNRRVMSQLEVATEPVHITFSEMTADEMRERASEPPTVPVR